MPRKRLPPRLFLKIREPRKRNIWYVRDGTHRESTGCDEANRELAERALADYIARKWSPPTGLGQRLLIDEVMATYLKDHAKARSFKDFLQPTGEPIMEWWSGMRIAQVNQTNCKAYVAWRTAQFRKRHPNSKKLPEKVTEATARHDLKTLRAALNWFKAEHDPGLIVPTVTLPAKPPPRQDYWLTRGEVARRLRVAKMSHRIATYADCS